METLLAIHTRRSISKVRPEPIPRVLAEKLLHAAVQAPNHHRVRPWRFIVLSGDARRRLGEVMAQSLLNRQPDAAPATLEVEANRPLRAPLLIAIAVEKPTEAKVLEIENVCAAAAAAQNLLLAAHDLGLAAMWRTGPAAYDPQVKRFLGLDVDQHLIAWIYVGYPEAEFPPPERPGFEAFTTWLE
ncbi:MAG: nitroreductase [Anaerolineales bacterium]|jgi:nitroreductase|nr:nitroreductase [Anaerolineales bacterium]